MGTRFEELGWAATPIGELSLRRRWDPAFQRDVLEIKLDQEYLMSSLFTHGETELARLALSWAVRGSGEPDGGPDAGAAVRPDGEPDGGLDVVVGGLGLGYTALEVLRDPRVGNLLVVEALDPVIDWHRRGLIPAGSELGADGRCEFRQGDFFALARSESGLDRQRPERRFDAVIVDIDHSPAHVLHPAHVDFYQPAGLRRLAGALRPGGVFALWSNDPPELDYTERLRNVFPRVSAEVVRFPNPLQGRDATNTVYLAQTSVPESI